MKDNPQQKLINLIKLHREEYSSKVEEFQLKMFNTDLSYHRANFSYLEACRTAAQKLEAVPENITPPVVLQQTEAMVAYLSGLFITNFPIYKPKLVAGQEASESVLEKLMLSYQDSNLWMAEELQSLRNVVKHNLTATHVYWQNEVLKEGEGKTFASSRRGLVNKTLSLYNCIWDTTIDPKDFQQEGMYFEHNEYLNQFKIAKFLSTLPEVGKLPLADQLKRAKLKTKDYKVVDPSTTLFHAMTGTGSRNRAGETDYSQFLTSDGSNAIAMPETPCNGHKVSTIYIRATAKQMDLKAESLHPYRIYKVILVNDQPVFRLELDLPFFEVVLAVGIVDDFGLNTKSIIEPTIAYQEVASTFIKAKIAAARRSVKDRAIYNPLYLSSSDVNNPADALKIPIRRNKWLDPNAVASAYRAIPFEDRTTQDAIQDASLFMTTLPNAATGISEFRQAPVRGNKSVGQFNLESKAADGRGYSLALTLEASRYSSIRELMRIQLITHTPLSDQINWSEIGSSLSFGITDGLSSLGMFDDLGNLEQFTQLAAQNPEFAPLVKNILKYVLAAKTPFTIEDFTDDTRTDPAGDTATPDPQLEANATGDAGGQPLPDAELA